MSRVTEVVARHVASSLDVCKQGPQVALHCATRHGVVVILCDLGEFTAKCRGPKDHNGNALPILGEARAQESAHAAGGMAGEAKKRRTYFVPISPEMEMRYFAMLDDKAAEPLTSWVDLAKRHGVDVKPFYTWRHRQLAEAAANRATRMPALVERAPFPKPGGKLL